MIAITATVDTALAQPRIRLNVTTNTTDSMPVSPSAAVTVSRLDPDGATRNVIVLANPQLSGGTWVDFDYHAPFNRSVSYVATAGGYTSAGATITLTSVVSWLMHPLNPALSVQVDQVLELADTTQDSTAILSYAFQSAVPIALSEGVRHSPAGALTVLSYTPSNQTALKALLSDSGPILLNLAGPDAGAAWWDVSWAWVQPGQVTYPKQQLRNDFRTTVIPYTQIDTPAGAEITLWTVADVVATYATVASVVAAFASVSDLATDTTGSTSIGTGPLTPDPVVPGLFISAGLVPDPVNPGLFLVS
jgi:hypothetical protein